MCELFPELPKELVAHVLRESLYIEQHERDLLVVARRLSELGVLEIVSHNYVKCVYSKDYDFAYRMDHSCRGYVELSDASKILVCPECGQPIEDVSRKTVFVRYEVKLNHGGIERYLADALKSLDLTVTLIGPATYDVLMTRGMTLRVTGFDVFPSFRRRSDFDTRTRVQAAGFFFAEPVLYVIASPIHEPVKTPLEEMQCITLVDILSKTKSFFAERIALAAIPLEERCSLTDVEDAFDSMIARHPGKEWQFFEQQFVPALLHHITENPALVEQYLQRLGKLSSTIFGFYHVPVGGPGQPDFISIDKFSLMRQLFEGNAEGDAKCYSKSALSDDDMATIAYHLDRNKAGATKSLVFVTSNDITSSVWIGMVEMKQDDNWRVIIIPKYLILELIVALEADYLLDMGVE